MRSPLPITVIIPTRNEAGNLEGCLRSVRFCARVIVVDSGSTDGTQEIAARFGAEVHQFRYEGGWPKKRQWAMENLAIGTPWTLLLDADERVSPGLRRELAAIVKSQAPRDGYWITLHLVFMGQVLRHGASGLQKLSFFRTGRGRFECLVREQTVQMSDVEIHEHIIMEGTEGRCRGVMLHENVNSLFRYIEKHNEYSDWSAARIVSSASDGDSRPARLFGNQAERRRALVQMARRLPFRGFMMPLLRFLWFYVAQRGFMDGRAGYYYCAFKAVQAFHIEAKVADYHA